MATKRIILECNNGFKGDDRVKMIGPKEDNDLIFFPGDEQLIEVLKARVAVQFKRNKPTKRIVIENKTRGTICEINLTKFVEMKSGRP